MIFLFLQANSKTNPDVGGDNSENEDEESSWSDWNDESIRIICLFCNYSNNEFICILRHMKETHNFDFEETVKNLTFYQKVKNCAIISFIFLIIYTYIYIYIFL